MDQARMRKRNTFARFDTKYLLPANVYALYQQRAQMRHIVDMIAYLMPFHSLTPYGSPREPKRIKVAYLQGSRRGGEKSRVPDVNAAATNTILPTNMEASNYIYLP